MKIRLHCLLAALVAFAVGKSVAAEAPPKLVVTIVVDQLRYDYLERGREHFANEGFRLLMDRGANMVFARYNYSPTITGPGHASYLSGVGPAGHGILGNDWFDKRTGKDLYCCADTNVVAVGTTNKSAMSPRNFIGATVADQMRLHFNSKVISLSLKDRGAILPAGKKPAGAFWFDSKLGLFITSTYYMTNLPAWVSEFNDRKLPESYMEKTWERLHPTNVYMFADDARGEGKMHGETNVTFNHTVNTKTNSLETMYATPFADEMLAQLAIAAIDAEQLGQGAQPDMLCLSFSSCDGIGHTFGPHSHEIQDEIFRLDRQLEKLFRHLDEKIGLNEVVIVLTADHGVAPTPEFAADMGLDGQRWDSAKFMTNLQTHLEAKFGEGKYFATMKIPYGDMFFRHQTLREKGLAPSVVAAEVREFALSQGFFANAFSREQLLEGRAPGQIGQFYMNGYNAERGADVMLVGKPFGIPGTGKTGTTHGSIYAYDTRVPVLFFGRPFKPGRYADEFYITDIAATLSAALRIEEPPGSIGKPFVRALADK